MNALFSFRLTLQQAPLTGIFRQKKRKSAAQHTPTSALWHSSRTFAGRESYTDFCSCFLQTQQSSSLTMGGWGKNGGGGKGGGGNQQRYHKGRTDMVVPGVTGVLVSCDPMATGKAIRELKLLFEPFKPLAAVEREREEAAAAAAAAASSSAVAAEPSSAAAPSSSGAFSLAAMLAEELDSFRRPDRPDMVVANMTGLPPTSEAEGGGEGGTHQGRHGGGPNNNNKGGERRPARRFRDEWFSTLETNCKGYVFVNIPKDGAAKEAEEKAEAAEAAEKAKAEVEETAEPAAKLARTEAEGATADEVASASTTAVVAAPTASANEKGYNSDGRFRINKYVTEVSEALMASLAANPRPVTRFSFRLIPVEASCNPTLPCIVACAKELADTIAVPEGRSLVRIGVVFNVKNNTTIQKEKNYIKAAVEAALPKNRFAVFGYWNTNWQQAQAAVGAGEGGGGKFLIEVDALLHVFVAHSTCCMGVQRRMTVADGRRMYNLHDFGVGSLALGDMAGARAVEEAKAEDAAAKEE